MVRVGSRVLEVGLGLIFVYLVFSLVCSALQERSRRSWPRMATPTFSGLIYEATATQDGLLDAWCQRLKRVNRGGDVVDAVRDIVDRLRCRRQRDH